MRTWLTLVLLWLAGISSASATPRKQAEFSPQVIVEEGRQFIRGTFPRNASWLGLYCRATTCELRATRVDVQSSSAKNVLDEIETLDAVSIEGNPIAVVQGLPLRAGPVETAFRMTGDAYDAAHVDRLRKLGAWRIPWAGRPTTLSWVVTPDSRMRYHLGDGVTRQFLFATWPQGHYDEDMTPVVHWAGDLDRDGKIDLLLSIPDDNCSYDERLYLSSMAGTGQIVRKAAQLEGVQGACGC